MTDFRVRRGGALLKNAVLIAGPTASGKSALAIEIARRIGGAIVNTDSMQVYSVLSVLTARPQPEDLAAAPHHLYGHVPPQQGYSTGRWLADVRALIASEALDGKRAVFVGGTGLYFRALLGGLSDMPEVPAEIRARWRARLDLEGPEALHGVLAATDRISAERLGPRDGQRIVRALEIFEATGRSITEWQAIGGAPLIDLESAGRIVLEPPRDLLAARIASRLDRMIDTGGLEEAKALLALDLAPTLPAMKAIGVPEFIALAQGRLSRSEALERAAAATRQYAKRQSTWFRNQFGSEWRRVEAATADLVDVSSDCRL